MTGIFGLTLTALLTGLVAQEPAAVPDVEFSIKHIRTQPGEQVILPLVVTSRVELEGRLEMELSFPADQLEFKEFKPGLLVGRSGWALETGEISGGSPGEEATLALEMRPESPVFFPSGVIGYATFMVKEDMQPGEILLTTTLDVQSEKPLELSAPQGRIQVLAEAVYGCFFYMH